ncbi:MAG: hypothetical protein GY715_18355, partial [Planctomycetes bacterium]|nr:hypothetical protein [Planctomycetota bacterium]
MMRRTTPWCRAVLATGLLAASVAAAPDPPVPPSPEPAIDLERAAALFAEARVLSEADGGKLWGRRLYGPMMFVDRATRTIVANQRDRDRTLARRGEDLWVGTLPERLNIGNTSVIWSGMRWTMVVWPLPAAETWAGALMMHECFHRIQPGLGIPLAVVDNHHLDTAEGRIWIRLEWRALAEAFEEIEPLASEALKDALVFRAHRRKLFGGKAAAEERSLELSEGLAEYTGLRLSGADAETQRRRALAGLQSYAGMGSLVRSFAYASGPPYGLLLDEAEPGWRDRLGKGTDYVRILRRAIRFKLPRKLAESALERAGLYDYEVLLAEEQERAAKRDARVAEYRRRFVDGPVLTVLLTGEINYQFQPYDVHALDGIGTVYGTLRATGPWGVIECP